MLKWPPGTGNSSKAEEAVPELDGEAALLKNDGVGFAAAATNCHVGPGVSRQGAGIVIIQ